MLGANEEILKKPYKSMGEDQRDIKSLLVR